MADRYHMGLGRIEALDGLRGGLAIAVMAYHLCSWVYGIELRTVGSYSVYMFFVLSGFAMAWAYGPPSEGGGFAVRRYWVARMGRILPLWWLATLLTVISALPAWPGAARLLENLTLLSALTPTTDIALGGWTIEVEVVFYLLFPGLLVLLRTTAATTAAFIAALAIRTLYVPTAFPEGADLPVTASYFQMPTFLAFFIGGMLLARLRAGRSAGSSWQLWLAGMSTILGIYALGGLPLQQLLAGPLAILLTLLSVFAVGTIAFVPTPSRQRFRRAGAELGDVSYGTYLLHPIVFTGVSRVGLTSIATVIVTAVGSLAAAHVSFRYFERPVARWARRRFA